MKQRISESFDQDREGLEKYIEWLRSTIAEYEQDIRRTTLAIFLLIAVFEVILSAPTTHVTIASLEVSKRSIMFEFIPALVAYLYLQSIIQTTRLEDVASAFAIAFNKWLPRNGSNALDNLVQPPQPLYWSSALDRRNPNLSLVHRADGLVSDFFASIWLGIVLAFEIQAYWTLYKLPTTQNIALFISIIIGFACTIASIFFLIAAASRNSQRR